MRQLFDEAIGGLVPVQFLPLILLVVAFGFSALVFSPLLWIWLFRREDVPPRSSRLLIVILIVLGATLVLGPGLWQGTLGQGPFDNPALRFIPMVLVVYGSTVALACLVVGAVVALGARLVLGKAGSETSRRSIVFRSALFVGLSLFVPAMSVVLWVGVRLAQVA